jgi:hypothetical protein
MKTLKNIQYSFKQLTQFTVLNKVLDPLASNINDSLTQATLHLTFTCMGVILNKGDVVTHENTDN